MERRRKVTYMAVLMMTMLWMNVGNVYAADAAKSYERDYLTKVFNSENGLEGTVANCIYSSEDGFLWIGGYAGLYRYDGTEFKRYLINERPLPVNEIVQDPNGTLWIGTNGNGLYCYDGTTFEEYSLDSDENGAYIINKLYCDSQGTLWVGTKAGIFSIRTTSLESRAVENRMLSGLVIHDISELENGDKIVVEKTGKVYLLNGNGTKQLSLRGYSGDGIPRCCSNGADGSFYIGTNADTILKVTSDGQVLACIGGNGLSSFNAISEAPDGSFWVCSDSGIGILEEYRLTKLQLPFDDSIEETCTDYQGNFWFASSRQGVLQLYENYFSNLGNYWGLNEIVNTIQWYEDRVYVGCDEGLHCYQDRIKVEDELVKACKGERIRQLYLDQDERLWVSTYQSGLRIMDKDGTVTNLNMSNSGLTTNQIRCVWQRQNKEMLIGTEEGVFKIQENGAIRRLVQDEILCTKRILDIKEDSDGRIYVATDGYGAYTIENEQVIRTYTKQQGMLSGVILKIVPSERLDGIWLVTGEEICFIDSEEQIHRVTNVQAANSLDLLLTEDGDALILAGNGYFRLKEEDLQKDEAVSYIQLNKQDGLPVDFTANAWNTIQDGILYMCGTTGVGSISLEAEQPERPIVLYVNKVTEDGRVVEQKNDVYKISANTHRLNLDIRPINYVHQNIVNSCWLEGLEELPLELADNETAAVSYTDLGGGSYIYHYCVSDEASKKTLAEISIEIAKDYTLWEEPAVRMLLLFMLLAVLTLVMILIMWMRERHLKKQYRQRFLREKEEEISRLAYRDMVTGVYNRNYFEQERQRAEVQNMYALFSVSVNHIEYLKNKYGIRYAEKILRRAAQILQECSREELKIYRISENGFFFWTLEPILLDDYIYEIKHKFEEEGEDEGVPLSFSVGAIYNNRVEKETIDELIQRCWKMRMLDEKHAEAKFIEGKMKFL